MNTRSQKLCAWSGIIAPNVMFGGLVAGGFIPPLLPSSSAEEIAAIYRQNPNGILLCVLLILITAPFYVALTAAIGAQMRRIEHRATPVLSYSQLGAGFAIAPLFVVPGLFWGAAAFRPERAPETIQLLNDLGWLFFIVPVFLGVLQNLTIGFAIISEKGERHIFPRWLGFFNIWTALLFIPGGAALFFKTGPFAWNGLLAFWIPAGVFGPWFFLMAIYVIKAATHQAAHGD